MEFGELKEFRMSMEKKAKFLGLFGKSLSKKAVSPTVSGAKSLASMTGTAAVVGGLGLTYGAATLPKSISRHV